MILPFQFHDGWVEIKINSLQDGKTQQCHNASKPFNLILWILIVCVFLVFFFLNLIFRRLLFLRMMKISPLGNDSSSV